MTHSLTKIWIHAIFSTKERRRLIKEAISEQIYAHIREKLSSEYLCPVRAINGTEDHIHILFLLNPDFSIIDIIKQIKGESSHWINYNNFMDVKFSWQVGYAAFSVSESLVKEVENYIKKQKEYHKKLSFLQEYELFLKRYQLINR